jgi:hypothetical protein
MFYADTIGLSKIYGTLQHFAVSFGCIWKPSALLEKLAKANQNVRRARRRQGMITVRP